MSNQGIWVVAEQAGTAISGATSELLGKAGELGKALGQPVTLVLVGPGAASAAQGLGDRGADAVWVVDHPELATYRAETYGAVAAGLVADHKPSVVLYAATSSGRDLAAYAAARLGVGAAQDVSAISVEGGALRLTRPIFGGNVLATQAIEGGTALITALPKAFEPAAAGQGKAGEVKTIAVDPAAAVARAQVKGFIEALSSGALSLPDAEIVVSGGRGVGSAEKFAIIEDLAKALGAAVGASRAVTDAGWRPANEQVGQTGVTVKPKLYIAAGLSGAVQHWVGMKESGYIVAINTDPEAPIMKVADLAIVGDLFKVIPEMIKEINAARGAAV